jgi:hypothetical protein
MGRTHAEPASGALDGGVLCDDGRRGSVGVESGQSKVIGRAGGSSKASSKTWPDCFINHFAAPRTIWRAIGPGPQLVLQRDGPPMALRTQQRAAQAHQPQRGTAHINHRTPLCPTARPQLPGQHQHRHRHRHRQKLLSFAGLGWFDDRPDAREPKSPAPELYNAGGGAAAGTWRAARGAHPWPKLRATGRQCERPAVQWGGVCTIANG